MIADLNVKFKNVPHVVTSDNVRYTTFSSLPAELKKFQAYDDNQLIVLSHDGMWYTTDYSKGYTDYILQALETKLEFIFNADEFNYILELNPKMDIKSIPTPAELIRLERYADLSGKILSDNPTLEANVEKYRQTDYGQTFNDFELFDEKPKEELIELSNQSFKTIQDHAPGCEVISEDVTYDHEGNFVSSASITKEFGMVGYDFVSAPSLLRKETKSEFFQHPVILNLRSNPVPEEIMSDLEPDETLVIQLSEMTVAKHLGKNTKGIKLYLHCNSIVASLIDDHDDIIQVAHKGTIIGAISNGDTFICNHHISKQHEQDIIRNKDNNPDDFDYLLNYVE